MTLAGKVAIVTGGSSGIGAAIVLGLAAQGAKVVIDYGGHRDAAEEVARQALAAGGTAHVVQADVGKVADLRAPGGGRGHGLRPRRHHGQQRRHRDAHRHPGHQRGAVRPRAGHRPQERVLRHADRRAADDRPGRRRAHHQHLVGARGLADAGQHPLLPGQGRHAHADAHRGRRARAARHPGGRRRPRRGGDADQPLDHRGSRTARQAERGHPARAGWRSRRRSPTSWCSSPVPARAT